MVPAKVLRVSDLMSMEEILASAYYQEFVKPEGWIYSVGMFFRPIKSNTLIGMLAVNRRPDQGDFTDEDMRMFREIHPHLESAFQRVCESERHHLAKGTLAAFLRKSPDALALLSVEGRLILLNAAGREACARWSCPDAHGNSLLSLSLAEIPSEIVHACQQVLAFSGFSPAEASVGHPKAQASVRTPNFFVAEKRVSPVKKPRQTDPRRLGGGNGR